MTWRSVHVRALTGILGAAIAVLAAAVPASASTTTSTVVLVPYLSSAYRYQVVAHDANPGFSDPSYDDSGFTVGNAAFGTGGGCPLDFSAPPATNWPNNTDLLVRRIVDVPAGTEKLTIGVAIDNSVAAFWNGVQIGSDAHNNCAARDSYVYTVPSAAFHTGANVLAVRATDTGGEDYFDITVTATVTTVTSPPSITAAATSNGQPYTSGSWTNHDVVVTVTCTSAATPTTVTPAQTVSTEGANQSVSGTCTDAAGGTAAAGLSGINIDKTAPVVTYSSHPATYGVADTVNITCSATDALSGVATTTCVTINAPAFGFTLGANTVSATATDLAGNTGSGSTQFTVVVTGAGICQLVTAWGTDPRLARGACELLSYADRAVAGGNPQEAAALLTFLQHAAARDSGRAITADQSALFQRLTAAMMPPVTLDADHAAPGEGDGGGDWGNRGDWRAAGDRGNR
jgi:hypothetical protein